MMVDKNMLKQGSYEFVEFSEISKIKKDVLKYDLKYDLKICKSETTELALLDGSWLLVLSKGSFHSAHFRGVSASLFQCFKPHTKRSN